MIADVDLASNQVLHSGAIVRSGEQASANQRNAEEEKYDGLTTTPPIRDNFRRSTAGVLRARKQNRSSHRPESWTPVLPIRLPESQAVWFCARWSGNIYNFETQIRNRRREK
jgi:hypothetical protein